MSEKHGIFVSYARADGEEYATDLRERLERDHPEIHVWQDRARLMGGVGWWKQITDAIEGAAYLVLVMTPAAIASEVVRKEWRHARQVGTCIFPVIASKELDFARAPKWMRDAHFYNLEKEWDTFVGYLGEPCATTNVAFMAPDMSTSFVGRQKEMNELMSFVVDDAYENPLPGAVTIYGPGGFGKTMLANALCHDENIQNAFDDGIFWVTLGENPNVLAGLSKLYAALTGERPTFLDVEDATVGLADKWGENDCLLVIDDVWSEGHLFPFLRGGQNVTRVITTRNFAIEADIDHRLAMAEINVEDGAMILTHRMQDSPEDLSPFYDVVRDLGQWPLLVELAGATLQQRMQRGDSVEGALSYLKKALEKRGVSAFDRRDTGVRSQAIERTIGVSLDQLNEEERENYNMLAVFPRDANVPITTIAEFWDLDEFDTEDQLQQLDALSLLKLNLHEGTVSFHNMMHVYLMENVENMSELHTRLLDSWGDPVSLPDDYAWANYIHHLLEAGQKERAHDLLCDFDWTFAKLSHTDPATLVSDFAGVESDADLIAIENAIILSMHILTKDKNEFAGQILGRLLDHESPVIQKYVEQAKKWRGALWLRPITRELQAPGGPLLRTLLGHKGGVHDVKVMGNGRQAISGGEDGTIRVWELAEEVELMLLEGHTRGVRSVSATYDGKLAVSGSDDYTVKLWDLENRQEIRTIGDHMLPVTAVAIDAQGRFVISASADNSVKFWDLRDPDNSRGLRGHRRVIRVLKLTPDGSRLLGGGDDKTVYVWDLETFELISKFKKHSGVVRAIEIFPDLKRALSSGNDRVLRVWNIESGEEIDTVSGHHDWINGVAITPDGEKIVSCSEDRTLRIWEVDGMIKERTLRGHTGKVNAVGMSPSGQWAISASSNGSLKIWDITQDVSQVSKTTLHIPVTIRAVAATSTGLAVSGSDDRKVKVWDIFRNSLPLELSGHRGPVRAIAVTPDGRHAVSGGGDKLIKIWDLTESKELATLSGHTNWVSGLAMFPDGRRFLSCGADRMIKMWDMESGEELASWTGHTEWITTIVISPDGRHAFTGGRDNRVIIWDAEHHKQMRAIQQHQDWITALALTDDGQYLISGSEDRSIMVWNWQTGQAVAELREHTDTVRDIMCLPGGQRIISVSDDHRALLWDLENREVIATYSTDVPLYSCALMSDERTILIGGEFGQMHRLFIEAPE